MLQSVNEFTESLKSPTEESMSNNRNIEFVRQWLNAPDSYFPSPYYRHHLECVVGLAQRFHDHQQGVAAEINKDHEEKTKDAHFSDRYHYALGQLEKAREFLDHGRAAAAMDALWRAKDGIE